MDLVPKTLPSSRLLEIYHHCRGRRSYHRRRLHSDWDLLGRENTAQVYLPRLKKEAHSDKDPRRSQDSRLLRVTKKVQIVDIEQIGVSLYRVWKRLRQQETLPPGTVFISTAQPQRTLKYVLHHHLHEASPKTWTSQW